MRGAALIGLLVLVACGDDAESPELARIRADGFSCTSVEHELRFEIAANQRGDVLDGVVHDPTEAVHVSCSARGVADDHVLVCRFNTPLAGWDEGDENEARVDVVKADNVSGFFVYERPDAKVRVPCTSKQ